MFGLKHMYIPITQGGSWLLLCACSCPNEVVFQRSDDLTTEQLLQQQKLEDQQQLQGHAPLSMGMANTANAIGFSYLLTVSTQLRTFRLRLPSVSSYSWLCGAQ